MNYFWNFELEPTVKANPASRIGQPLAHLQANESGSGAN
jgi:hypothetical protein